MDNITKELPQTPKNSREMSYVCEDCYQKRTTMPDCKNCNTLRDYYKLMEEKADRQTAREEET